MPLEKKKSYLQKKKNKTLIVVLITHIETERKTAIQEHHIKFSFPWLGGQGVCGHARIQSM